MTKIVSENDIANSVELNFRTYNLTYISVLFRDKCQYFMSIMSFDDYESLPTQNFVTHMTAGAIAGVMEHCIMYPLDSVKVVILEYSLCNFNHDFPSAFSASNLTDDSSVRVITPPICQTVI